MQFLPQSEQASSLSEDTPLMMLGKELLGNNCCFFLGFNGLEFEFRQEQEIILFSGKVQSGCRAQPASTSVTTEISVGKAAGA